jgi:hypothetical protein
MSFMTEIQNFRMTRKIETEKNNAVQTDQPKARSTGLKVFVVPFALAFVFALTALVAPAAAVSINLTAITDVINAFIGIIEPIINLVIAIIPLWFIMQILGFIMGLLAAILAMIKFGNH